MEVLALLVNTKISELKEQPKIKKVEKGDLEGESKAVSKGKILALLLASFWLCSGCYSGK